MTHLSQEVYPKLNVVSLLVSMQGRTGPHLVAGLPQFKSNMYQLLARPPTAEVCYNSMETHHIAAIAPSQPTAVPGEQPAP